MYPESKNPVRNLFAEGVQVMATPSRNRRRDVYAGFSRLSQATEAGTVELEEVPPSSVSRVPSSTTKSHCGAMRSPKYPGECNLPSIERTPTRGLSKLSGRPTLFLSLEERAGKYSEACIKPPERSINQAAANILSSKAPDTIDTLPSPYERSADSCDLSTHEELSAQATSANNHGAGNQTGGSAPQPSVVKEIDVYAALNWDHHYDDML